MEDEKAPKSPEPRSDQPVEGVDPHPWHLTRSLSDTLPPVSDSVVASVVRRLAETYTTFAKAEERAERKISRWSPFEKFVSAAIVVAIPIALGFVDRLFPMIWTKLLFSISVFVVLGGALWLSWRRLPWSKVYRGLLVVFGSLFFVLVIRSAWLANPDSSGDTGGKPTPTTSAAALPTARPSSRPEPRQTHVPERIIILTPSPKPLPAKVARVKPVRTLTPTQPATTTAPGTTAPSATGAAAGVTSNNQSGGVTAGQVGTVNQNTVGRSRSKFYKELGGFAAQGQGRFQSLASPDISDEQIDEEYKSATAWLNDTAAWLFHNMGLNAEARFADNSDWLSRTWNINGQHKPGETEKRNNMLNALASRVQNLRAIIASDTYDP